MEIYAIVFCVLAALTIIELYSPTDAVKAPIAIACVLVLSLFSGLRWETGNDWVNYLDHYQFASTLAYNEDTFEVGYRALVVISRKIGLSYTGFLLLTALISNTGFVIAFARLGPVALLTVLFFTSYYLGLIGTQRQMLAAAFACIAMLKIYDRRHILAISLIGIAMLFHVTAIVCIFCFLVPRRAVGLPLLATAAMTAGAVAFFGPAIANLVIGALSSGGFIASKLLVYTLNENSPDSVYNILFAVLKRVFLAGFFFAVCRQPNKSIENYAVNSYVYSVVIFLIFISIVPILAFRTSIYFFVFELYLVHLTIKRFGGKYWRELFVTLGLILSAFRLYWNIVTFEPLLFIPYKSVMIESDHTRFSY